MTKVSVQSVSITNLVSMWIASMFHCFATFCACRKGFSSVNFSTVNWIWMWIGSKFHCPATRVCVGLSRRLLRRSYEEANVTLGMMLYRRSFAMPSKANLGRFCSDILAAGIGRYTAKSLSCVTAPSYTSYYHQLSHQVSCQ